MRIHSKKQGEFAERAAILVGAGMERALAN